MYKSSPKNQSTGIYDETVRSFVCGYVEELEKNERLAVELQTDEGREWLYELKEYERQRLTAELQTDASREWLYEEKVQEEASHHTKQEPPVVPDDTADYIVREYVYSEADRWSNPRIRAYIDNQYL